MKTIVIIPAGGSGKRFGGDVPKQYLTVGEIPVILRTLLAFEQHPQISAIIVAAHPEWHEFLRHSSAQFGVQTLAAIVEGGAERQFSIANALHSQAAADADVILVHDAVRPFVSAGLITSVIQTAARFGAAVPALPPKDTIKRVVGDVVAETPERASLRAAQTPQGFRAEILRAAYNAAAAHSPGTDDASLAEAAGFPVTVVAGEEYNIKITTQLDLQLAEIIAAKTNYRNPNETVERT